MNAKRLMAVILALLMVFAFAACGGEETAPDEDTVQQENGEVQQPEETEDTAYVEMAFGDITITVPDIFQEPQENQGFYGAAGPDSSITVSGAMPIDIQPEDWTEDLVAASLESMYGATYSDLTLAGFQGDVDMNGTPAVWFAFYGTNSKGVERFVQNVYLFDVDNGVEYFVNFVQSAENDVFTQDMNDTIINSITLY